MPLTRAEWKVIVRELNASFLTQTLPAETAALWFTDLQEYPAERVLRAVRYCRRTQSFMPRSSGELIDAMLANARESEADPSEHRVIEARDPDSPGVPPPASVKLMIRNLLAKRVPDAPEQPAGRSRDQQLAELKAEMGKEAEAQ